MAVRKFGTSILCDAVQLSNTVVDAFVDVVEAFVDVVEANTSMYWQQENCLCGISLSCRLTVLLTKCLLPMMQGVLDQIQGYIGAKRLAERRKK